MFLLLSCEKCHMKYKLGSWQIQDSIDCDICYFYYVFQA